MEAIDPHQPRVTAQTLVLLNQYLDDKIGPAAMAWFVRHGWLNEGEGLDQLSQARGQRVVRYFSSFLNAVFPEEAKRRKEQEEEQQRQQQARKAREARWDQLDRIRPIEYETLTAENSPRPRQFKLVAEFLTEDSSPYFQSDRVSKMRGLVLFGASRFGKTAACWEAIERFWVRWPEREVVFLKTVRFVRIAKSRHLGAESKAEFEELFERALNADLLVLDDLGTEKLPESAEEVLFELLDVRTECWRFTIITSNFQIEELASMFSRRNAEKIQARIRQFFLPVCFDTP